MATIDGLITELGHIKVWCEAQVTAGVPKDDIAQTQFELLRSKIRLVSTKAIDIEKAARLTTAVTDASATIGFSDKQRLELVKEINKCVKLSSAAPGVICQRKPQECSTLELYLTESEIAKLTSGDYSERRTIL